MSYLCTVQTFTYYTSRADVWQRLVAQTPMDNKSEKTSNGTRSLRNEATFSCEVIHAYITKTRGGNQACGHVLCTGCHAFSAGIKCWHYRVWLVK